MKKDYQKYKKWLEKRGNSICLVCDELFLIEVPKSTWWIVFGSPIHIVNTMQGFLNLRNLTKGEKFVYSGNKETLSSCWSWDF